MSESKTKYDRDIEKYISTLDEQSAKDTYILIEMMQKISGQEPKLWNAGTLGFDTYHYKYASGREGDGLVVGFYPRNGKTSIYVMDGTYRYTDLLSKLGKHTITGYCLYIKQLSDVDLNILGQIIQKSYDNIKLLSKDGPIDRILWQDKK